MILNTGRHADGYGRFDYQLDFGQGSLGVLTRISKDFIFYVYGNDLYVGDFTYEFSTIPPDDSPQVLALKYTQGPNDDSGFAAPVPEPATIALVGFGLIGLAGFGRKKLFRKS